MRESACSVRAGLPIRYAISTLFTIAIAIDIDTGIGIGIGIGGQHPLHTKYVDVAFSITISIELVTVESIISSIGCVGIGTIHHR